MSYIISTQIEINASQEKIWKTLMDFENYTTWNPFIKKISGEKKVGAKLNADIGSMKFKPTVQEISINEKFSWLGSFIIPGLFDGKHEFIIQKITDNRCLFIHQETFKGILVSFMKKKLEKEIKPQFELMNEKLKLRVE